MGEKSIKNDSDESILETAKKRFSIGIDADAENRELAIEDMKFRAGDQWPEEIKNQRKLDRRPCLTVNKIPQNVHQITNDQRQNRPKIIISPVDDNADIETAKIYQGIVRNIERNSNADTAYDQSFDSAVTGGRGYFRVLTDYCDSFSFDQEIQIKPIQDPNSVVLDPSYREPDGSDANWGFIFEDVPRDDFESEYPDAKVFENDHGWDLVGSKWETDDTVRVAEYFYKEFKREKLYRLPDGSTALASDIKKSSFDITKEEIEELEYRWANVPTVKWCKFIGNEILEKTTWAASYIPIIPVHGEELVVDGKRVFEGIIRHAKDPQRMYNYWATSETEAIALAPKAPYIVAEGQVEGYEKEWSDAHLKLFPYLTYKPKTFAGQLLGPPQRNYGEANVQAITQARMLAADDLKSTTGIYDASLGNRSNESSGVAIRRRAHQAQTGNFHFIDNLSRSIKHLGRIIVELIPEIYDTPRTIRIIGTEDKEEIVRINEIYKDDNGKSYHHNLKTGRYDVAVSTGPSYETKRQEAVESMLSLSKTYPQVAQVAGDIMVKNMDFPDAEEISTRLKKTIPPDVLSDDDQEIPQQVKAQLDQMGALVDELTQKLNDAQDQLEGKMIDLESKERIEFAKIEKDYTIKMAELKVKEQATPQELIQLQNEMYQINERLNLLNFQVPINQEPQIPINQDSQAPMQEAVAQEYINPTGGMSPGIYGEQLPNEEF